VDKLYTYYPINQEESKNFLGICQ